MKLFETLVACKAIMKSSVRLRAEKYPMKGLHIQYIATSLIIITVTHTPVISTMHALTAIFEMMSSDKTSCLMIADAIEMSKELYNCASSVASTISSN